MSQGNENNNGNTQAGANPPAGGNNGAVPITFEELEGRKKLEEQLKTDSLRAVREHAAVTAGFHDYDAGSYASRQVLRDLCTQYDVFFEEDEQSRKFLDKIRQFTEIDASSHEGYVAEVNMLLEISRLTESMNSHLDELETEHQQYINKLYEEKDYFHLSRDGQAEIDKELTAREETINNRRRALASIEMYIESMKNGDLKDLESLDQETADRIDGINHKKGYSFETFRNDKGEDCYYINASGVDYGREDRPSKRNEISRRQQKLYATAREKSMKDVPIFPHEPRMTDIKQGYSGTCYLLGVLSNIAGAHPQKIRDMIKDNGDGTATVRLYGKDETKKPTKYYPVYVRVDKSIPVIGDVNEREYSRLGDDSLWVDLISKAYMMSGLHLSQDRYVNLPHDFGKSGEKPSVASIEGGDSVNFAENLLGPEGVSVKVDIVSEEALLRDYKDYHRIMRKRGSAGAVDVTSDESIAKHVLYSLYEDAGGKMKEQEFLALKDDTLMETVAQQCGGYKKNMKGMPQTKEGLLESLREFYGLIKTTAGEVRKENGGWPSYDVLKGKTQSLFSNELTKRQKELNQQAGVNGKIKKFSPSLHGAIVLYALSKKSLESTLVAKDAEPPALESCEEFFGRVKDALDKGLPIICGSETEKKDVKYTSNNHVYSIIGAIKTTDEPPRYYFRIKNSNMLDISRNGVVYRDEKSGETVRREHVKDGISDIRIDHFAHDFNYIHIVGEGKLDRQVVKSGDQKAQQYGRREGYELDRAVAANVKPGAITSEWLTDGMKVANDLHVAMRATNSRFSNDSPEYKRLTEGLKTFRKELAQMNGKKQEDINRICDTLLTLVNDYETHVRNKTSGPSRRQTSRLEVCSEIRKTAEAMKQGINPEHMYERAYARMLMDHWYETNGRDKAGVKAAAEKLFRNKAFRNLAGKISITAMMDPEEDQLEDHMDALERVLRGRGIEKGVDMGTMEPKRKFSVMK